MGIANAPHLGHRVFMGLTLFTRHVRHPTALLVYIWSGMNTRTSTGLACVDVRCGRGGDAKMVTKTHARCQFQAQKEGGRHQNGHQKTLSRPSERPSGCFFGDHFGISPPQKRPKMGSKTPFFEMLVTIFAPPYLTIRLLGQIRGANRQIGEFGAEGSFELGDGCVLGTDFGLCLVGAGLQGSCLGLCLVRMGLQDGRIGL